MGREITRAIVYGENKVNHFSARHIQECSVAYNAVTEETDLITPLWPSSQEHSSMRSPLLVLHTGD